MGNYVIEVGNYVIVNPSQLGNYKIADSWSRAGAASRCGGRCGHRPAR
jgi:hypothetical protein